MEKLDKDVREINRGERKARGEEEEVNEDEQENDRENICEEMLRNDVPFLLAYLCCNGAGIFFNNGTIVICL